MAKLTFGIEINSLCDADIHILTANRTLDEFGYINSLQFSSEQLIDFENLSNNHTKDTQSAEFLRKIVMQTSIKMQDNSD